MNWQLNQTQRHDFTAAAFPERDSRLLRETLRERQSSFFKLTTGESRLKRETLDLLFVYDHTNLRNQGCCIGSSYQCISVFELQALVRARFL